MTEIVIRTVDGGDYTWDSAKFGFTVRGDGYLMIQRAGEVTDVSVAIFPAGQWISVVAGSQS